jgi:UDP-N-acetylglucosamine 1-carboxyvinyltransferase
VSGSRIEIREPRRLDSEIPAADRSIRATLLMLSALLARTGYASVPLPGGCDLGNRGYDVHALVLEKLGARLWQEGDRLYAEAPHGLTGADVELPIRSTGATVSAIFSASLASGSTRIWNPHVRPENLEVIGCLNSMGARIETYGQERIDVSGVGGLQGTRRRVESDNMEALTWLIASVVTGGDIEIGGFPFAALEVPLVHLRESGARFFTSGDSVIVRGGRCLPVEISTGPYPGINSDMQPLFAVYGACARGESRIVDLRFRGRYAYANELAKLGVTCIVDGDLLRIRGATALRGAHVRATDLRAGIALVLAGLVADGETRVEDGWQVVRGYDRFFEKIDALGGDVTPA